MSKKPVISKEAQVLLKLLKFALGTEVDYTFPDNIDWKEVIRLSYEHKVSALAVDGLEVSKYDPYKGLGEKETEKLKAVLVPWIKDVENTEWSYCYYVEVLKTLCRIFRNNGLTPIILKGYGLSLNYPRPSHRGAGDIDVFLVDGDGRPAAERGDEILRQFAQEHTLEGIAPHHTHFEFKGITIENHHELADPKRKTAEEYSFISTMKELVVFGYKPLTGIDMALEPSLECHVIFQLYHMFCHFAGGGIIVRQISDYLQFIRSYSFCINWGLVSQIVESAGLKDFMCGINGILSDYFIFQAQDSISTSWIDYRMSNQLVNDLISLKRNQRAGITNFKRYYRNRWHYSFFENKNWFSLTAKHSCNYLMRFFKD